MKKSPLTNIDKFEKVPPTTHWSPNCEMFWYVENTFHYQHKNDQPEGIEISWEGNPFQLESYFDYVLILKK